MILQLLPKPKLHEPCNHCGRCCRAELCYPAKLILGPNVPGPCPFLIQDEQKFLCQLVLTESENSLEPILSDGLGIGLGCSMEDDDLDLLARKETR